MADLSNFTKGQLERFYAIQIVAPLKKEISDLKKEVQEYKAIAANNKLVYTIEDVMDLFKVSRQTVYNWEKVKKLIRHKIEGRVFFKKEDIDKLINYSKQ